MSMTKKSRQFKPSLLEAWLGYIYDGNTCPKGLKALLYLRKCLATGITKDEDVWAKAPLEVKEAFIEQFYCDESDPISQQLENLEIAIRRLGKDPTVQVLQARLKELEKQRNSVGSWVPGIEKDTTKDGHHLWSPVVKLKRSK
jgi:hypothetical protein